MSIAFSVLQKIQRRLEEDFATIQTLSSDPRLIHPNLPPSVFEGTKGEPCAEMLTAAVVVSDVCE